MQGETGVSKNMKVGHAGTLDPLATGLLVVCSGGFTKRISEIQHAEKEYTGTMVIGSTTASYDLETAPENFKAFDQITEAQINSVAKSFLGEQKQIAPAHSAKKIDGKRAYQMARKGEDFVIKEHNVIVKDFEIVSINLPEISFRITCSKGTYIRSMIHDFGRLLATGAHLSALCRTRIGNYYLKDAVSPAEFLLQLSDKQNIQ